MSLEIRYWLESQFSLFFDRIFPGPGGGQSRELVEQSRHPWFYTSEWQSSEATADDDLLAGRFVDVRSISDVRSGLERKDGTEAISMFDHLRQAPKSQ
jgi:hypothetical protein